MTVGCIERRKKIEEEEEWQNAQRGWEGGMEGGMGLAAREKRTRQFLSLLIPMCYGFLHDGGREQSRIESVDDSRGHIFCFNRFYPYNCHCLFTNYLYPFLTLILLPTLQSNEWIDCCVNLVRCGTVRYGTLRCLTTVFKDKLLGPLEKRYLTKYVRALKH